MDTYLIKEAAELRKTAYTDFVVACTLDDVILSGGETFKITYDPVQVQLLDFAAQTQGLDVGVGLVPGTDLEILSHNTLTGELTFRINKPIPPSYPVTGVITLLKFKALQTVTASITVELV